MTRTLQCLLFFKDLVLAVMAVVVGALQITDNGISHSVTILEATLLVTQVSTRSSMREGGIHEGRGHP